MIGAELQGDSGRTRIALTMHDQRGDPQSDKLLGQRTALRKLLGIVAKELIDREIDVQAIDQQLPGQFSRAPAVSDVSGPGQLAVGPFDFVFFPNVLAMETATRMSGEHEKVPRICQGCSRRPACHMRRRLDG